VSLPLDVQTAEADACYQPRFLPSRPAPQDRDAEEAVARLAAARAAGGRARRRPGEPRP
jgi:thiamine pyrophosphate-dependent acetolactate synthase large subunit-like protein